MRDWFKLPKSDVLYLIIPSIVLACLFGRHAMLSGQYFSGGFVNPWLIVATMLIVFSIGLWFDHKWAKWLGLAMMAVGVIYAAQRLLLVGFTLNRVGMLIGCGFCIWSLWREPIGESDDEDDDGPFLSLVLLLKEPQYLEATVLAQLASRAWDLEITGSSADEEDSDEEDDDKGDGFIVGESPLFICRAEDAFFMIHNFEAPYFDESDEVADEIRELRASNAVRDHQAWLGVDFASGWEDMSDDARIEKAYRMIARLLAEVADDNCLAIVDPDASQIFVYDPETEEKLRSNNPLAALRETYYAPVAMIEGSDEEMQAAVEEARLRWPEFVEAFEARGDDNDSPFLIKAPFSDEESTEFMWVEVTSLENEMIYGTLGNEPAILPKWKEGDRVQIKAEDLNDWMCVVKEEPLGGFTLKLIMNRAQKD